MTMKRKMTSAYKKQKTKVVKKSDEGGNDDESGFYSALNKRMPRCNVKLASLDRLIHPLPPYIKLYLLHEHQCTAFTELDILQLIC